MHDECKLRFLELKAKRTYRFIIFKIEEKQKQVVVEKVGEPTQSYEDFTASLPADECRYAVYDFDFVTAENCQKSRIFFIAWYYQHLVPIISLDLTSHAAPIIEINAFLSDSSNMVLFACLLLPCKVSRHFADQKQDDLC